MFIATYFLGLSTIGILVDTYTLNVAQSSFEKIA